jgi:transglutaminase-like putative cysteine protease
MRFEVERRPSDGIRVAELSGNAGLDPERYKTPNTLIPLGGVIRELAVQESKGRDTDQEKVRAFYDYVVRNMSYNKDGTGWGRGDAIWACTNKRGNCTDFHSLFIGMSRSQGIPARFIIGVPIPGDTASGVVPGYHCWAEHYDEARGWLPVDASEAKKSGETDAYFNALPNDRIEFTAGRDLKLVPPQQGPPLNYFIYPYVEGDGTPLGDVTTTFRFERTAAAQATGS